MIDAADRIESPALSASYKFTGQAAWLIVRQAEKLYRVNQLDVYLLRHTEPSAPRELAVFDHTTETLVVFGPNVIAKAAVAAGVKAARDAR